MVKNELTAKSWRRFKKNKLAKTGLIILIILTFCAIFAPVLAPYSPDKPDLSFRGIPQPPSLKHLLGTDNFGRDILSRALYGGRVSLLVGICAVIIFILIGTFFGALSGYYGGILDAVIMRIVDLLLCLPTLFFILIIQTMVKPSIWNVILVIGLTSWAGTARLVRGQILSLKETPFIEAARAIGASDSRIIFKHLIPNASAPIIVTGTLGVAATILLESVLSFLGLGVQEPMASWGNMLQSAQEYIFSAPWMSIFPGLLIMIAVLAFNFIGDGLRDALDPKMKV
ncbi:MAG: oligopeptide ABC transporter permease [Armatimonadota bacterium]